MQPILLFIFIQDILSQFIEIQKDVAFGPIIAIGIGVIILGIGLIGGLIFLAIKLLSRSRKNKTKIV
jgi:hypothetical protein